MFPPNQPPMPLHIMRFGPFQQFGFGPGPGRGVPFLLFVVVAVLALIVAALLIRGRVHPHAHGSVSASSTVNEAVRILDERFARGDVDVDDYKMRRDLLAGHA
jgi:uncharacterized membrane protein